MILHAVYFASHPFPLARDEFAACSDAAAGTSVSRAEFADTSTDSGAYWRRLSHAWGDIAEDEALVTVEQDIVVRYDVFESFAACPRDWCEFRHALRGGQPGELTWKGLGCDKFSASLRLEVSATDILYQAVSDAAPREAWHGPGQLRWNQIDGPLFRALEAAGYECHEHTPPVRHLTAE